jgi:hypothetical protein
MSKTVEVHEQSQRILAYLDELSGENIFTIINSILDPTGHVKEIAVFGRALAYLLENDEITIQMRAFSARNTAGLGKDEALDLMAHLQEWFRFEASDPHWTLAEGDLRTKPIPELYITDKGQRKAVEILTARGVEWWRPRRNA